ncbi:hypothetical protein TYRP_004949 [Tyrophagus putrescentiae]|nr:hypothetical protein TYRP_004949 [Tyrophagus putrescentiae]
MGDAGGIKEFSKVTLCGVSWGALIVYCDEFQMGGHHSDGMTALFAFIVAFCLLGLAVPFLEKMYVAIGWLAGFFACYVLHAVYEYTQTDYVACVVLGGITVGIGFCYCVSLVLGGGK